jgi:hypothetical protein
MGFSFGILLGFLLLSFPSTGFSIGAFFLGVEVLSFLEFLQNVGGFLLMGNGANHFYMGNGILI